MKKLIIFLFTIHFLLFSSNNCFIEEPETRYLSFSHKELEKEISLQLSSFFPEEKHLSLKRQFSPSDIAESGNDTTTIGFIYKENSDPVGIVKIIELDHATKKTFSHEVEALAFFNTLPLSHFHPVFFFGSKEISIKGSSYGLIVESIAPGKSLNQSLKERDIEEIKIALKEIGISLKELHSLKSFDQPDPSYLTRYGNEVAKRGPFTLIHGDAHPGNIFYDKKTNKVTFIDFASADAARQGAPCHLEIANFLLTLEILSEYYDLPFVELKETFLSSYSLPIDEESLSYYTKQLLLDYKKSDLTDKTPQTFFLYTFVLKKLNTL